MEIIKMPEEIDVGKRIYILPNSFLGTTKITAYEILDIHKNALGVGMNLKLLDNQKGLEKFVRMSMKHYGKIAFGSFEEADFKYRLLLDTI